MKSNKLIVVLASTLLIVVIGGFIWMQQQDTNNPTVVVYKSPTCGCCAKWVAHMEEAGFEVETHDMTDLSSIKANYGVGSGINSCHTAVVDGYVVEGHVPAEHVKRLLEERPDVTGLAVPGMPIGSPGMEGSYSEAYDVLTFDRAGKTTVFAHVEAK